MYYSYRYEWVHFIERKKSGIERSLCLIDYIKSLLFYSVDALVFPSDTDSGFSIIIQNYFEKIVLSLWNRALKFFFVRI